MNNLSEYKYKYDLHVHTSPVSKCGDFSPCEVVDKYIKRGFDGIVITNHFSLNSAPENIAQKDFLEFYLRDYREAKECGEKRGLKVFPGIEIKFPENYNEYLVYGLNEDDISCAYGYLSGDYKTFYNEFKRDDILIIQAHPFRKNCILQDVNILDGIEAYNLHPGHNPAMGFAAKIAYDNPHLLITGGTDFHHEGHEGMCAMCTREKLTDSRSLVNTLKSKDIIFDSWGNKIIPPYNCL